MKKIIVLLFCVLAYTNLVKAQCSGKPTAGIAMVNTPMICYNLKDTIQLFGNTSGSGIAYQWQQATKSNGLFTNIVPPNSSTAAIYKSPALTATTYYRCVITCTNSGLADTTNVDSIVVAPQTIVTTTPAISNFYQGSAGAVITASCTVTPTTYTWTPSATLNASTGATVLASPTTVTTYTVKGTDMNGCSASATAIIYSVTGAFTSAMNSDSVIFNSTSNGYGLTYSWSFGDASPASALKTPKHGYTTKCKKYWVCLTVADAVSGNSKTTCDSVYVKPTSLGASFTYTINSRDVVVNNTASGKVFKSIWNFGDGTVHTLNSNASDEHIYANNYMLDSIRLTVKDVDGCTSTIKKTIFTGCTDSIGYTINDMGATIGIGLMAYSNQTITDRTWTINGGGLYTNTTDDSIGFLFSSRANYNVCLQTTDANKCTSSYCEWINLASGINSIATTTTKVYPTPTDGKLSVDFAAMKAEPVYFTVFDLMGKAVYKQTKNYTTAPSHETMDLTNLPNGVYLLQINTAKQAIASRKIIIARN